MAVRRMNEKTEHLPVLLTEAVTYLMTDPNGIYVDATFGRGSHARAILNQLGPQGRLIAFDQDPEAVLFAKQHFMQDKRFGIYHSSFMHLAKILSELDIHGKVNGILFDLGVSSPQLDNPARGFSFSRDGKLDMRMDPTSGIDAATWLAQVSEEKLAHVLWTYGEERFSRRIARRIVEARAQTPITTTGQLAAIIQKALPRAKPNEKHPATRSFQAIRIAINDELTALEQALPQALSALADRGRLAVISFHSLEDRIVKHFIRMNEKGEPLPRGLPIKSNLFHAKLKTIVKPIKPSLKEITINPRARSAILRIAEKLL